MDGRQFLKEAKEAYSENYKVNFSNFTVEEFKRSIYHYIGREGTAINYLYSLLRQKTRAERKQYDVLTLHGGRQADVDMIFSPGMSNGSKHSLRWRTGKDFSLKLKNRD